MSSDLTKKDEMQIIPNFVIFQTSTGKVNIEVFFKDETLWLSQKKMAELFETTSQNITLHLKNIFESGELMEKSTCKDFLQVQKEGNREVSRKLKFYNLQAILSVGYRVNSGRAIEFRKWANDVLQDFIIKGFTIDNERLKNTSFFYKKYFLGYN